MVIVFGLAGGWRMLADFFNTNGAKRALDAYATHTLPKWPLAGKLVLYELGRKAFGADGEEAERFLAFEQIYCRLDRDWQVFRPRTEGRAATVREAYDLLRACDIQYGIGNVSLRELDADDRSRVHWVSDAYDAVKGIKHNNAYPWMAASKFLHFANPRLFPIYDKALIWERVLSGRFAREFRGYCRRYSAYRFDPDDQTEIFNTAYTFWAASLMGRGDSRLMDVFGDWFANNVGTVEGLGTARVDQALERVRTYDAAAVEMLLIGASFL